MPKNSCIMQIWAEPEKSALPICNYSQILYQFLTFTQNLKRSHINGYAIKRINPISDGKINVKPIIFFFLLLFFICGVSSLLSPFIITLSFLNRIYFLVYMYVIAYHTYYQLPLLPCYIVTFCIFFTNSLAVLVIIS